MSVGKYGKVKNIVVLHLKRDHFDQWPPLPPCGNSQPVESFQTEMKKGEDTADMSVLFLSLSHLSDDACNTRCYFCNEDEIFPIAILKSSIDPILTFSPPERMRKMSEESEFDEDDDEGHDGNGQKFGGFTSTVCVNFSQDDLRLATIPGQEGVSSIMKKSC